MFIFPDPALFPELGEHLRWEWHLLVQSRLRRQSHEIRQAASEAARPLDVSEGISQPAPVSPIPVPVPTSRIRQLVKSLPFVGRAASFLWKLWQILWRGGHQIRWRLWLGRNKSIVDSAISEKSAAATLIFVGDWNVGWGQFELIQTIDTLKEISDRPVRLILAGLNLRTHVVERVRAEIARRGLADQVSIFTDPDAIHLREIYAHADLFVSFAQQAAAFSLDKYGVGFRAALAWDVPIVAFCPDPTRPPSGAILLDTPDPDLLACACHALLLEPSLRRRIRDDQRTHLAYLRSRWLSKIGHWSAELDPPREFSSHKRQKEIRWRIEGPFHSSYSLAIVNRELARALEDRGETVELVSRDGPGPIAVPDQFFQDNPRFRSMWQRGHDQQTADVGLRNQYPPFVHDLQGELKALACYAWEESGFPKAYVREFNANLDFVTVTSQYVAKVLRDNGLRTPIHVVGDGIDQITRQTASPQVVRRLAKMVGSDDKFCFLHISSCLPRKGVDVLLRAWTQSFHASDAVLLIIKASKNQHHDIESDVARLRAENLDLAPIVVLTDEFTTEEVRALYQLSDVAVAPSRGEGFGLPIAEALSLGKPVITTAFGGQIDFCAAEDSWLCDYDFAYATSHVSSPLSVWTEPKTDSLIDCLKAAYISSADERMRRGSIGSALIRERYSWDAVAARLKQAKAATDRIGARAIQLPTVAWISTWNNRCGVADYSQSLTCAFPPDRLKVFANWNAEQQLGPDSSFVQRCWEQSWHDPLDGLFEAVDSTPTEAVVLQFNFGFYDIVGFRRLVERLIDIGRHVYVTLHSTTDIEREDLTIRLGDLLPALKRARRVFVHSVHDLNRLKVRGLTKNVSIQPFGMPRPATADGEYMRRVRPLIATFGYLLPHKGALELIEAISQLRAQNFDVDLLMLNATYPAAESEALKAACEAAIARHDLVGQVEFKTEFLPSEEVVRLLGLADLVIFPYQNTQESASAAVRMGLASARPVVTTPVAIFDDVASISHVLPGFTPSEIAVGVRQLLENRTTLEQHSAVQAEWVRAHQWPQVSRRLYDLIRGEVVQPLDFYDRKSYERASNKMGEPAG